MTDCYRTQTHTFSFEFFPPKTDEGEKKLFETIAQLKPLAPAFVSVTYGAMGTTRANTIRIVEHIKSKIGIEAAAHLTCVAQTRKHIEQILEELHEKDIENIVALRGDPPKGDPSFTPAPGGLRGARDLVALIRRHPRLGKAFSIAVAGYPEGHVECRDKRRDLEYLKGKVDEGADVVITQLFFHNPDYFDFVTRARAIGITVPIVPGIMPVTHGPQIQKFAAMCGASIPHEMKAAIERLGDDQTSVEAFGIEYATKQCAELLANGAPGLHFYTLNKSKATRQICTNLGMAAPSRTASR